MKEAPPGSTTTSSREIKPAPEPAERQPPGRRQKWLLAVTSVLLVGWLIFLAAMALGTF